jgi:hypothetical protein
MTQELVRLWARDVPRAGAEQRRADYCQRLPGTARQPLELIEADKHIEGRAAQRAELSVENLAGSPACRASRELWLRRGYCPGTRYSDVADGATSGWRGRSAVGWHGDSPRTRVPCEQAVSISSDPSYDAIASDQAPRTGPADPCRPRRRAGVFPGVLSRQRAGRSWGSTTSLCRTTILASGRGQCAGRIFSRRWRGWCVV